MGELTTAKRMMMIALLVVLWGISWPIYKVALEFTPPLLFAGLRTLLGGLLLGVILVPRWNRIRWKENWRVYAISGIFNVVLFYGLQTVGLMYVPSGLFSVLVYLQPVLVGIFAWMWLGKRCPDSRCLDWSSDFWALRLSVSADFQDMWLWQV